MMTAPATTSAATLEQPPVFGELDRTVPDPAEVREARSLPLATRFHLGARITGVQQAFLDEHGFILFSEVASEEEVARICGEVELIQERWLAERRKKVFGIPLFVGKGVDGGPFIQRFAFTSCFSEFIHDFVRDERFIPICSIVGKGTRVGDREKDGVVFNRNLNVPGSAYARLGWHTDGLRDLFYGRMPGPMLNVGMHFDEVNAEDGGLRIIPGSHKQGLKDMLLRKAHFVSHGVDPLEVAIETKPGDLTVHDGRTWHRVERCPHEGPRSLRRTMYVPYLTHAYEPKGEGSKTPLYHHLGRISRAAKAKLHELS